MSEFNLDRLDRSDSQAIAIIGMACRFPGAKTLDEFWHNLIDGVESISFFSDRVQSQWGIDPAWFKEPNYVKADPLLNDLDLFDANFFGFSPRQARLTNPEQRIFLECAWEALEQAGYSSEQYAGSVGVFAGSNVSHYLDYSTHQDFLRPSMVGVEASFGNDLNYLATQASYQFNLKGPSLMVQTACSTALVAVHVASQSLLNGECDIALAGAVNIKGPRQAGYFYQEGGIFSPDGHCRAFDANAQGTVPGSGVGIVVLKRLSDAIADGDFIYAAIRGSAINNDGSIKVGYTAPSIDGQAAVVSEALAIADIAPKTIAYIEAHGTGTALGDPIEVAALTEVFRASTNKTGFCAIGSVKTNIGHLGVAAGIPSLIKAALALKHQLIPPSLHFEQPNPKIDFANSPFYVNARLTEWQANGTPRRAGVSSLGVGGTNAHIVLQEAPLAQPSSPSRPWQLLLLSAKTPSALETTTANFANYLQQHPELNLADVAYTLQVGRRAFPHRRMVVCEHRADAIATIAASNPQHLMTHTVQAGDRPMIFLFPGQGAQYVQMGRDLYEHEPVFRKWVDRSSELLVPHLGLDLRQSLYPNPDIVETASQTLQQTAISQPALFAIEYALAQLWQSWGIRPTAMVGHSIGEYVAATIAGIFSLEDALALVATRGRLMQQLPSGTMLAVPLPEAELRPLLNESLALAAVNAPSLCVVSGEKEAIATLHERFTHQGIDCRQLHTSHAFHSPMMEPIMQGFAAEVQRIQRHPPQIPLISNVTGTWMTAAQAIDPNYWAMHLRQTVNFAAGVSELLQQSNAIMLEVGPGRTLSTFMKRQLSSETTRSVFTSLRHPQENQSDVSRLLTTLGQLWLEGVAIDWTGFYQQERRHRVPLPTYPFERQRYWLEHQKDEGGRQKTENGKTLSEPSAKLEIENWFYLPFWKPSIAPIAQPTDNLASSTLIFLDDCGLGAQLAQRLQLQGKDVVTVKTGSGFQQLGDRQYIINPQQAEDYETLIDALQTQACLPHRILHLWTVTEDNLSSSLESLDRTQMQGFYSLLFLAQALGKQPLSERFEIAVISNRLHAVTGEDKLHPEKATVLGPVRTIPQEYPNIGCRSIDVTLPSLGDWQIERFLDNAIAEIEAASPEPIVAYRGTQRWVQTFEPTPLPKSPDTPARLQQGGVYLITGGLGGIGLTLAEHLAKSVRAKLALLGHSAFPDRSQWSAWLSSHDGQDVTSRKIRQLLDLEACGAEILTIQADVSDLAQMQEAIAQITTRFGQINGVIHAAGVPGGGAMQRKIVEQAEHILAPKVKGTLVLSELFKDKNLDFILLCSSIVAIEGRFGQADYTGANAFLDAFAHSQIGDRTFAISVNWDGWQTVGMGAAAVEQLARSTLQFKSTTYPLFDRCRVEADRLDYLTQLHPNRHWLLNEHRMMGKPMLPGTAYLELARAAYTEYTGSSACELREVTFMMPLFADWDGAIDLQTRLQPCGNGFEFVILSATAPDRWQEHARGEIVPTDPQRAKTIDLEAVASNCDQHLTFESKSETRLGSFSFGPRWNTLQRVNLGTHQGWLQLELPIAFAEDLQTYHLHPALLDSAVGFLSSTYDGQFIPFSYKCLRYYAPLPAKLYSHIRAVEPNAQTQTLRFDITLLDECGRVLAEIEDYTLRRVEGDRTSSGDRSTAVEPENGYLSITSPGQLNTLTYHPTSRQQPGDDEVEIEVQATGLNFKEILFALGLIPNPENVEVKLGLEGAGKVVRVGKGVKGIAIGDEAIAFGTSCFSPFITSKSSLVVPKPPSLTFEQAATIPIAFSTAYLALIHYGRLCSGETVLIHAAAGGVGMAAVQIAQSVGAKIIATAGTPEKRDYLRSLGIEHVFDSRSLDFAAGVMSCTNGRGVDVVLNSLSGEFIERSLSALARYGRFLELGLRDILSNRSLELGVFEKRLSFLAIQAEPEHPDFTSVWQAVGQRFRDGVFQPLPHRIFAVTEIENAFSYMAQAKHIGKLVVSLQDWAALKKLIVSGKEDRSLKPKQSAVPIKTQVQKELQNNGILPCEGVEVFDRVLAHALPQIVISTRNLLTRTERDPQPSSASVPANTSPSISSLPSQSTALARNEIERAIAAIWQEVLGVEQVGVRDNFFELGGDSLSIVQVRSKLQNVFPGSLSTAELFDYPTVSALAAHLSRQQIEEPVREQVRDRSNKQKEALETMQLARQRRREHE
ncbi:type I polyketide synthase [Chroococcidiopsis sp. CCNUC1]|uniref:type I polyketide synthase n=1 Tax=Chroococcidiopsis sp. CCNUC1 TaxID=2653189 RepID=UPI00201FB842|nr:type I polyketide synthase [Chroococcidiopsis sp. CCNUC1]URD53862.1 SDR family NAD(P)-dependent oxidoreductase [Chroococcidiopsis sp. CCNUC1]